MASNSSIIAWKIPVPMDWSLAVTVHWVPRVGHDGVYTCIHAHTHTQFLRNVMNTYSLFVISDFSFYRDEFFLQSSS